MLTPWKKVMTNLDSVFKSRDITLPTKVCFVKAMVFPAPMYGYESWTIKKAECWRMMLSDCGAGEDSWESLGLQGYQTSHSRGNQPCIFIGRTGAETEPPIFWPPNGKNWLIGKDLDPGKDWGQEKGTTEDEMIVWHHWLNGHEFDQALGDSEGQGSLVCFSS